MSQKTIKNKLRRNYKNVFKINNLTDIHINLALHLPTECYSLARAAKLMIVYVSASLLCHVDSQKDVPYQIAKIKKQFFKPENYNKIIDIDDEIDSIEAAAQLARAAVIQLTDDYQQKDK